MRLSILRCMCLVVVLYCCYARPASAQRKITETEWNALIDPLSKENWKTAETLSLSYLKRFNAREDTSTMACTLRYMYVRSVAARLARKEITKEAALSKVSTMKGKPVITPILKFKHDGLFNLVSLSEDKKAFFVCGANDIATEIQTFETYSLADTAAMSHADGLEGSYVRMYATIRSLKTGGQAMPHLEIALDNTEVYVQEDFK